MKSESDFTRYIGNLLDAKKIPIETGKSSNVEIDAALKTASKNLTGKQGFPDIMAIVQDFVLIMENKSDYSKLELKKGTKYEMTKNAVKNYAVNGAVFYAQTILKSIPDIKIFAFGNAGDEKHHIFKPVFVGKNITKELATVKTFINFTAENIDAYYKQAVLGEELPETAELQEMKNIAQELHEHLRNYGQLGETEKPLVVAAIILALSEKIDINDLTHEDDEIQNDGAKIFDYVERSLKRAKVSPEVKRERVLAQFQLLKNRPLLNTAREFEIEVKNNNEHKETIKKKNKRKKNKVIESPLRYFTEYIKENVYDKIKDSFSKDYLGIFYREFISYSGGDGQTLGVVITPPHITELFCDLVDLKPDDVVLDPCCGTGGFLLAALSYMLKILEKAEMDEDISDTKLTKIKKQRENIRANQLHGVEVRDDMFSIATTSMILRGDGRSNLICNDFFAKNAEDFFTVDKNGNTHPVKFTVGFMNPPYSQAKNEATRHLSELRFIEHLLEIVQPDARVAVIVPVSAMIGKTKDDKDIKRKILEHHTLEGVISLNKNTFYQIGTVPCIAIFKAKQKHRPNKIVKFINFEDDGFELQKHEGYIEIARFKDCKEYLLDCWRGKEKFFPSKFMVETTIEPDDEWLHSFYYYNDNIPAENDFINTVADYLTFEFNMITHGRGYLFNHAKKNFNVIEQVPPLQNKNWKTFIVGDLFNVKIGKAVIGNTVDKNSGKYAYITRKEGNNGVDGFIDYDEKFLNTDFPVITVGAETAAPFVQNYPFFTGVKVNILTSKTPISVYALHFVSQAIKMQQSNYNYAFALISSKMRTQKILLPVNEKGLPDFEYMEKYIALREQILIQQYLNSVASPAKKRGGVLVPLNKKIWKPFFIGDLFRLETGKGKGVVHLETNGGTLSYLGATNRNNAVLNFVQPVEKLIQRGNCIAFIRNGEGSIGYSVYKAEDFIATSDITCGYADFLNKYVGWFITTVADKVRGKYNFNYKRSDTRLKREKLMLPVNEAGLPDFEYMEAFTRNQFAQILKKYLDVVQ